MFGAAVSIYFSGAAMAASMARIQHIPITPQSIGMPIIQKSIGMPRVKSLHILLKSSHLALKSFHSIPNHSAGMRAQTNTMCVAISWIASEI